MSILVQADNTYAKIELLVRRLTALSSQSALPSSEIQELTNTFYNSDFPYAIKVDQMRSVYTFFTQPYIDRYPLDVNYNQGVRAPIYFEGIQGFFYKDRDEFYRLWPRWPTKFQYGASSLVGQIINATQANPCQITSPNHGLSTGDGIYIENVQGMVQLNGLTYTVTVLDVNNFTIGVDSTGFTAYTSGGDWDLVPVTFNFIIPAPFLAGEVTIGGVDVNGNPITISDDGKGNLYLQTPSAITSVPAYGANYPAGTIIGGIPVGGKPIPGMYNINTLSPGLNSQILVGTVNYVSGQFSFTNPLPLQDGTQLTIWVSQYQTGRPYCALFWNNYFQIRPVPKLVHKVEIEVYLTPVQFMQTTDSPILNQWVQYIAYGVSCEILRQRQDMEGLENLLEGFRRQEGLVLERQGVEEIGSRNKTIFAGTQQNNGWNNGWQNGFY